MGSALRLARDLDAHDQWERDELLAFQRAKFAALVAHARASVPLYRERYRRLPAEAPLNALPPVDKSALMERFEASVTDQRLTLDVVQQHAATIAGDGLLFGEYRVLRSGGTSGVPGWFVYDRPYWRSVLARQVRTGRRIGFGPTFPRRTRIALVQSTNPLHLSGRLMAGTDVGLFAIRRLSASDPLSQLVSALEAFQPDVLSCYPTIGALLAGAQLDGTLRIAPSVVFCAGEELTPDLRERIQAAWRVRPRDLYGSTETGTIAIECEQGSGMHVFEDFVVIEPVDAEGEAVATGELSDRVFVTNLWNLTQPIIRYELSDRIRMADDPCPCGLASPRIVEVAGRSDDVVSLPGSGDEVPVHAKVFRDALGAVPGVREYQVTAGVRGVDVALVPERGAACEERVVERAVRDALIASGVDAAVPIVVRSVESIARSDHSGKCKLVQSDRATVRT